MTAHNPRSSQLVTQGLYLLVIDEMLDITLRMLIYEAKDKQVADETKCIRHSCAVQLAAAALRQAIRQYAAA